MPHHLQQQKFTYSPPPPKRKLNSSMRNLNMNSNCIWPSIAIFKNYNDFSVHNIAIVAFSNLFQPTFHYIMKKNWFSFPRY